MTRSSSRGSTYEDSISEEEYPTMETPMWQPAMKQPVMWEAPLKTGHSVQVLEIESPESVNSEHSTLAYEPETHLDLKTPTVMDPTFALKAQHAANTHVGPLEQQLLSLMSKVALIERAQPTVMAEDYQELSAKVAALEAEKATWQQRHEALYTLRDEDLANLIKVRCLLADERREHTAIRKLRDDDLHNVIELRNKLAQATWTKPEGWQRSARQSRNEGHDLWQAAKMAAMEQRVLELEKHNEELIAHAAPSHSSNGNDFLKLELLLEENLRYREKMAMKVQTLRSEKEALQKDLARLEDANGELEAKFERLQRRAGAY